MIHRAFELLLIFLIVTVIIFECSSTDPTKQTASIEVNLLHHTSNSFLQLTVYDQTLNSIKVSEGYEKNIVSIPAVVGKYFINVSGDVSDYGLYTQVSNLQSSTRPGSTRTSALELTMDMPQAQSFLTSENHWYYIDWTLQTGETFIIETYPYVGSDITTTMNLYDANGNLQIEGQTNGTNSFSHLISPTNYPSGKYYLSISDGSTGQYAVCYRKVGSDLPPDPSSNYNSAYPVSIGVIHPEKIEVTDDQDWYKFEVVESPSDNDPVRSSETVIIITNYYSNSGGCTCDDGAYYSTESAYVGDDYDSANNSGSVTSDSSGGCDCSDSDTSPDDSGDTSSGGCDCSDSDTSPSDSSDTSSGGCDCSDSSSSAPSDSSSSSSGGCDCGDSSSSSGGSCDGGSSAAKLTACQHKKNIVKIIRTRKKIIAWILPWIVLLSGIVLIRARYKY